MLQNMVTFVDNSLSLYDISPSKTNIGVINYGDQAVVELSHVDGIGRGFISKILTKVQSIGGERYIDEALEKAYEDFLKEKNSRKNFHKVLVLFTAGESDIARKYILKEKISQLKGFGVETIVLNVGEKSIDFNKLVTYPSREIKEMPKELNIIIGVLEETIGAIKGKHNIFTFALVI